MEDRERANLMEEGKLLEQKLQYLGKKLEELTMVLMELGKAKESLKGVKEGNEGLIPIGGEILVESKFISEKVVFPIGAGYYMKMSKEDAEKKIDKLVEDINVRYKRIKEEVMKSETELIDLLRKVQQA